MLYCASFILCYSTVTFIWAWVRQNADNVVSHLGSRNLLLRWMCWPSITWISRFPPIYPYSLGGGFYHQRTHHQEGVNFMFLRTNDKMQFYEGTHHILCWNKELRSVVAPCAAQTTVVVQRHFTTLCYDAVAWPSLKPYRSVLGSPNFLHTGLRKWHCRM